MKTFCISQCMEQYTQNGLKNTSNCPKENATRYIVRLFFKYQSNIKNIWEKLHERMLNSPQNIQEHKPKWDPKYLKMADLRKRDTYPKMTPDEIMLRTTFSAVTVRVKQKTIVYNFEQKLNISQEIEEPIPNWPRKKRKWLLAEGIMQWKSFLMNWPSEYKYLLKE